MSLGAAGRRIGSAGSAGALVQRQWLSGGSPLLSGHNRWSKIRHDKGKEDARKSKVRTVLSQQVYFASKTGGPDPTSNPQLAIAIENAKRGHLAKSSIDAAIAKGQGKSLSGAPLENMSIEAMLPFGVGAIIEYQTESKNKILNDVRSLVNRRGGSITPTAFMFEKKGRIWFENQSRLTVDEALDEAIEAGATDITTEDGKLVVDTAPEDVKAVAARLNASLQLEVQRAEIVFDPKEESKVTLADDQAQEVRSILDVIEEEPNLQNIYISASSV